MEKLDPNCIQNILALTPMQEGMLFHYLKTPNSHLYFEQLSLEISGKIDAMRFEYAWNRVVQNNEILRTVFRWEKIDTPSQIILNEHLVKPVYYDLSSIEPNQKKIRLQKLKDKDRDNKFDLHEVPFRVTLCKIDEENHQMIISNHHILYDGWSNGIILKEFFEAYHQTGETAVSGKPAKTPFKEYIKWIQSQDMQEHHEYWREYLSGLDSCARLPVKVKKIDDAGFAPGYLQYCWPLELKENLERFVKTHKITLASLIYGAWGLLLNIYNNTDDAVFGITSSGRSAKINGIEEMVGLFINTLPLRVQTFEYETVKEFLRRLDNSMQLQKPHEAVPLVQIHTLCEGLTDRNEELFDTVVALENYPLNLELRPDALITPGAYHMVEMTHYDLTVGITVFEQMEFSFIYNQTALEQDTVSRLAGHFKTIVKNLIENPGTALSQIEIITSEEKNRILCEFNNTETGYPTDKTIQQLFEAQASKAPDYVAIFGHGRTRTNTDNYVGADPRVCPDQNVTLTYRQLNEQSDCLAGLLTEKGVLPDSIVGIMMERSVEMIIGLLGILKTGNAYLPIDPGSPQERIQYMLEDSKARILLGTEECQKEIIVNCQLLIVNCKLKSPRSMQAPFHHSSFILNGRPRRGLHHSNHLAYIIYTSGSTGNPKGVPITHANLCPLLHWGYDIMGWGLDDHVLQTLAYYFDWSAWEIFLALTSGASLYMISEELLLNPGAQLDFIKKHDITVMEATPTRFQSLVAGGLKPGALDTLKCLCIGAEKLTVGLVKSARELISSDCRVFNLYGPTEATIIAAALEIDMNALEKYEKLSSIPIGRMIGNGPLLILNQYLKLCPVNVVGELHITGDGVAGGYLNNPELTAEKFNRSYRSYRTNIFYRTGDLGRWLSDSNIEYLGRIDQQVKIRGFRIELGEIENCLRSHPNIKEAVVLVEKDAGGENYLRAYIVGDPGSGAGLKEYISRLLPVYMIPAHFQVVENIPMTPSGKIDRRALAATGETLNSGVEYIAPQSEMEKTIAQIWREVLGVENIGIHDRFFDRGGNSLSIIRLSSRLSQTLQKNIPVTTLFNHPTIASLVDYLFPAGKKETVVTVVPAGETKTVEIAVIGMAGRFPKAKNIEQFWENLKNGVEGITFFSREELNQMDINPEWLDNPDYVPAKGVLPDHDRFDAYFFGYTPAEAGIMDPQARIFHECVWEALENAAYDPESYTGAIGLFAGASPNPFWEVLPLRSGGSGANDYPGLWNAIQFSDKDYLSTRIAYKLDLKGPCVTLQTACSTSLTAVDQASRSLLDRACDMALAGGVSVTLHDQGGYLYHEGTIMSPDGHCRAFDAKAHGTVGGNGVGVVVLKRLHDAIADGDHIMAVIKGLGINNDGKNKVGFTAPSSDGQAAAIRAAMNIAGVNPESIGYIEAHGTGTPLGDPIEIEGLKKAFNINPSKQTKYCAIGSVKTNIGHLDAAAGIAGFIKTVLALYHRMIPPSLFFERPNPAIDFENSPFYVNTVLKTWESKEYPLRAGVSSFGLGGTNVHVVLEKYASGGQEPFCKKVPGLPKTFYYLIPLSAKTKNALDLLTLNLTQYFEQNPNIDFADATYTLQIGRQTFKHRRTLICSDLQDAVRRMSAGEMENGLALTEKPTIIFMFSGQGNQYVNMGLDLYQREPVFHDLIDQCFALLKKITGLDMKPVLYPDTNQVKEAEERIYQFLYTTPIKFIFEYALARLLISWGIKPDAMIGHSFGEYVAACLAGVFSLEDGLYLAALRGEVMHSLPEGAMLSVPLSEDELIPLLNERLSLATVDAPSLCVVSGPIDAIEAFAKKLNGMGHESIRFRVPKAGHSWMVEPIQSQFKKKIAGKTFNKPTIPYISGMTGKWITAGEAMSPDYWVRHLRATVRFADGLTTLFKEPNPIFLQVGPGKGLTMFVNRHPSMKPGIPTFNMLRHPKEETADVCYILNQVSRLWLQGVKIDWPAFHAGEKRRRIPLPTYPFEENVFPAPKNLFKLDAFTPAAAALKKNPDISAWFYIPSWQRNSLCRRRPKLSEGNLTVTPKEHTLVVMDRSGIGLQLRKELEARGHEVFIFESGNYDDFIKELARQDKYPYRVYHLTGIDAIDNTRGKKEQADDALDRGFYSLLYLVQALVKHQTDPQREIQLEVVTSSAQEVTGEEELCPGKAPIYGLCRVIPQEYSFIRCRCNDILQPDKNIAWKEEWLTPLLEDLCNFEKVDADQVVAYRGHYRWVQTFKPLRLEKPEPAALPLRVGGVYLITGGLGAIGLILARHLAVTYKAKLVLIGRSEFPTAADWPHWLETHPEDDPVSQKIRKLMEIEALGGQVMIMSADVASSVAMRNVPRRVEKTVGSINGVIHSAGIVGPQSFTALTDMGKKEAQMHFEPKIYGLLVLAEILKDISPEFCLVMSSTAAVLGGLGFGAYSAANAFMDSYIHQLNKTAGTRWYSINWDGWKLEEQNFQDSPLGAVIKDLAMTPEEGTEVMERVLANESIQQVVQCTGDLQLRIDRWSKLPTATQQPGTLSKVFGGPGTFFQKGPWPPEAKEMVRPARPHLETSYEAPNNPVEETLAKIWQDLLGYDRIGIRDNFFALNGDSLKAVIAVSTIHKQMNIKVPLTEFFAMPTISELARYITAKQEPIVTMDHRYIAIPPVEKREYYPLSSAQKRMFILNRMDQESTAYNITSVLELLGEVEVEKFRDIFTRVIYHSESLRTSFLVINNEEPVQRIHGDLATDKLGQHGQTRTLIEVFGPTFFQKGGPPEAIIKSFIRPFDLSKAPLLRLGLIKEEAGKHILILDMHHIISDGTSMGVLLKEFMQLYQGQTLAPLSIQYKDYACMQRGKQYKARWERQADYWRRELSGVLPELNLPTDYPRPLEWDFAGRQCGFVLDSTETSALKALARAEDVTLYMVLLSIYTIMLARLAGQEELLVGAPMAGRGLPDVQQVIGLFINTLVMRCFPAMEKSFRDYQLELKAAVLAGLENQDYPFEDLVEQLALPREAGRNPLFDAAFVLQNMQVPEIEIPGLKLTPHTFDSGAAKLDIALIAEEIDDTLCFTFEYRTSLFSAETMERFSGYFKQIAAAIADDSRQRLSDIDMLSREEKSLLIEEFNRSETIVTGDSTLQQLFREQVERTPDHVAVVGAATVETLRATSLQTTYRQLNEQSDYLTGLLMEKGVLPDSIAAIMMARSVDLIIGILGILKAGGIYLPIDPDYPQERIEYMLKDSEAAILLTDYKKNIIVNCQLLIVNCKLLMSVRSPQAPFHHSSFIIHHSNLAYIIYTSGTTGRPRGVPVKQRGVVNLVLSHWLVIGENSRSRISQVSSISFDAMVAEIWPCLLSGASLVICDDETRMSPRLLKEWLIRRQITHSYQPTAVATALLDEEWPEDSPVALEVLRTGGDRLVSYPSRRYPFRFFNLYGPTEDSVWTTWREVQAPATPSEHISSPSIGRPVPNHYVYIMGHRNDLRPIGCAGELCITGIGLAAGYLNKPELTVEKFNKSYKTNRTNIVYKTGDLARWLHNGNIEFLGRIDQQVKIRGFRIELGEIESCLTAVDNIKEAVVIDRQNPQGEKYLCAYIVYRQEPDKDAVIKALSRLLPRYMIPAYFIPLPGIPLTPNGKIDRRALPAPEFKTGDDYTAPTTPVQNTLVEIWSEILGIPKDKISIHDDFFQLGGHSLKANMVIEKIHKNLLATVPLNKIFETPTIDALASYIDLIQLKENLTRATTAPDVDPIREEIIL